MVPKEKLAQSHASLRSLCRGWEWSGVRMRLPEGPWTLLDLDITHGMDNDPM